jgi:paraquat-inducible protein B
MEGTVLVMPAIPGGFAGIEAAANQLLSKLSRMPFEKIGNDLDSTLHGASGIVNGAALAESLTALHTTLSNAGELVKNLNTGVGPAMKQLPAIASDLQASVAKTDKLIGSVNAGYGDDSKFNRDVDRLLSQLNDTARALRALADLLTRHPEALVRGRPSSGPE